MTNTKPSKESAVESHHLDIVEGLFRLMMETDALSFDTRALYLSIPATESSTVRTVAGHQFRLLAATADEISTHFQGLGALVADSPDRVTWGTAIGKVTESPGNDRPIVQLIRDHERIINLVQGLIPLAKLAGDDATALLLDQRTEAHRKFAWTLRSLLEP